VTSLTPPASPTPEFTPPAEPAPCPGELDVTTPRPPAGTSPPPTVPVSSEEVVFTSSDGEEVEAILSLPGGESLPGVVMVHGGFGRGFEVDQVERLASMGYAVIGPDYRADDIGGREVDDVAAAARFLAARPEVDPSRIAIMGTSHGASIAGLAAARFPNLFRSVVWASGAADWACIWALDEGHGIARALERSTGTTPDVDFDAYAERSPLYWVDQVRVPVLVIHSEHDGSVPPGQSQLYADALAEAGVDVTHLLSVGRGHRFLENEPVDGPDWQAVREFLGLTLA
jgi:dipeptidyl aminopeptidase/acylaminoacyl peptidase